MFRHLRFQRPLRWFTVLALVALTAAACESSDPMEKAKQLIQEGKTSEAAALLEEAHKADPKAPQPIMKLGEVAEKDKDWAKAIEWFELGLEIAGKGPRADLFKERLYEAAYSLAAELGPKHAEYEAGMVRAAKLEEELEKTHSKANKALFALYEYAWTQAIDDDKTAEAAAIAKKIGGLYYDQTKITAFQKKVRELTQAERQAEKEKAKAARQKARDDFDAAVRAAFEKDVKAKLVAAQSYDETAKAIVLANEFAVPEPTEDGLFNPSAEGFEEEIKYIACGQLSPQLAMILNAWAKASPVQHELTETHVAAFFEQALEGQTPQWKTPFDAKKPPESGKGLIFQCSLVLPTEKVVKGFWLVHREFQRSPPPAKKEPPAAAPAPGAPAKEGAAAAPAAPAQP